MTGETLPEALSLRERAAGFFERFVCALGAAAMQTNGDILNPAIRDFHDIIGAPGDIGKIEDFANSQ